LDRFVLPYPPSINRYWTIAKNARRITPTTTGREYKELVRWQYINHVPLDGPVHLRIHVYRPARRGDLDNILKTALDALEGVAYNNDKQIVEIHATRHEDKENPRIEIEVGSTVLYRKDKR